ncbi:MAG TPA: hypothetical protein VK459_05745 [Polyangiaceae bacterium]|nr:hypothetical protein [Polyangiaceae bacterium]
MPRPKSVKTTPARPPIALAAAAFAKIKPRLAKLKPEEVTAAPADMLAPVSIVLGALPSLRALRDAIVEELPKHPIAHLDDLEDYAHAAWYADVLHENQGLDEGSLKQLQEEAAALRESLLIAAEPLAHRGMLDAKRLAEIKAGRGKEDAANDLMALSELYSAQWDRIKTKTPVEEPEIRRADEIGQKILMSLMTKDTGKPVDSADRRARAFTLLDRAYKACRRAAAYIRWEQGDVDELVPPLVRRGPGRRPGSSVKEDAPSEANGSAEAGDAAEA